MRRIAICLGLQLVLSTAVVAGQPTQATSPSNTAGESGGKNSDAAAAKAKTTHYAAKRSKTSAHTGAERPQYRLEYGENSVEVINGDATKKVEFRDGQAAATNKRAINAKKNAPPSPMQVEVMNGASTDTQYFYGNGQDEQIEAMLNKPVVIGVQSSRTMGGNKHPVVTRVNSAGSGDALTASSGGQPVTTRVSPRPKRPEYQPDVH